METTVPPPWNFQLFDAPFVRPEIEINNRTRVGNTNIRYTNIGIV